MKNKDVTRIVLFLLTLVSFQGCGFFTYSRNYTHPEKPRFADSTLSFKNDTESEGIQVVTYNIKNAEKIPEAIKILEDFDLDKADIICLQEMSPQSTKTIARVLGYNYVYYPATAYKDYDFGNAILTHWPIVSDSKIILPHLSADLRQRIAVKAVMDIRDKKVAAYCVHLGVTIKPLQRGDQVDFIVSHLDDDIEYNIVAGDFNTITNVNLRVTLEPFLEENFINATEKNEWTLRQPWLFGKKLNLDHIFVKGFDVLDCGTVENRKASDHIPVWAKINFNE